MRASNLLCLLALPLAFACSSEEDGSDAGTPLRDSGGTTPDSGGNTPDSGGTTPDSGGGTPDSGGNTPDAGGNTTCDPGALGGAGCGGDVVGAWTYRSACGTSPTETQIRQVCPTINITANTQTLSGGLSFTATNYVLTSTNVVDISSVLPTACTSAVGGDCAMVQAALRQLRGLTVNCTGAGDCSCSFQRSTYVSEAGTYTSAGGVLTTQPNGGGAPGMYNYCVEGTGMSYRKTNEPVVYVLGR